MLDAANDRFLRLTEVENIVGLRRSKIYQMAKRQEFPSPLKIGEASRWSLRDLSAWMDRMRQAQD